MFPTPYSTKKQDVGLHYTGRWAGAGVVPLHGVEGYDPGAGERTLAVPRTGLNLCSRKSLGRPLWKVPGDKQRPRT